MTWLAEALTEVDEALTEAIDIDGFGVFLFVPSRYVPPCAVVSFGSPMLTDGETYDEQLLRLNIDLIAKVGTNETVTSDLITMVEGAVPALIEAGYSIEQVGEPFMLTANSAQYLAATVSVIGAVKPRKEETA